ncbi:hypothetical protein B7494_g6637 [Chlorociboria aeruginascens]|nr:hypothetical protein B7494_g6637 [Chlorociboria aeruginascens]
MSAQGYYGSPQQGHQGYGSPPPGPQYPQQAYQQNPYQNQNQYPPQGQYQPGPQMGYQQGGPPPPPQKQQSNDGCLKACLAALCCCCAGKGWAKRRSNVVGNGTVNGIGDPSKELIRTLELLQCSRFCEYCKRSQAKQFPTVHLKQAHSYFLTLNAISITPEFCALHQPFNTLAIYPQIRIPSQANDSSTRESQGWPQIAKSIGDIEVRDMFLLPGVVPDGPHDNGPTLATPQLPDMQNQDKGKKRPYEEFDEEPHKGADEDSDDQNSPPSKMQRTRASQEFVKGQANNFITMD